MRPGRRRIVDPHELGGGARLLESLGHHDGDGLVIVLDLRAAEQLAVLRLPLPSLPAFSAVTMASTPGAAFARSKSIEAMRPLAIAEPTT